MKTGPGKEELPLICACHWIFGYCKTQWHYIPHMQVFEICGNLLNKSFKQLLLCLWDIACRKWLLEPQKMNHQCMGSMSLSLPGLNMFQMGS
jgi:hypothetical protein